MSLKDRLKEEQKAAMRARDKIRLGSIRMLMAAIKQQEVDHRIELDDDAILVVLTKMVKQRKDSITQFSAAGRTDLADTEKAELAVLEEFLPQQLTDAEIDTLIDEAMAATGATGMQDMGKVMGQLKSKLQGRADMGAVSGKIRQRLG